MDTAQTYTYEDAYEASLKYFDGDELAAQVWVTKYALKDSDAMWCPKAALWLASATTCR